MPELQGWIVGYGPSDQSRREYAYLPANGQYISYARSRPRNISSVNAGVVLKTPHQVEQWIRSEYLHPNEVLFLIRPWFIRDDTPVLSLGSHRHIGR